MNHAALVLAQLESWLDLKNGGESADSLSRFYSYLRSKMMEAGVAKSARLLDAPIEMILHVRSSWQQLDHSPSQVIENSVDYVPAQARTLFPSQPEKDFDRVPFSQSA